MAAIGRGEIDLAYGYGREISGLQQYAVVFCQIAKVLYGKKNIPRAFEIINEAEQRILKGEEGPDKANGLLTLLSIAARIDPVRGFEVMTSAVKAVNRAYPSSQRREQVGQSKSQSGSGASEVNSYERLAV